MAQNLKDEILENKPYVDIVLGPDSYRKLPTILNNRLKEQKHIVDTQLSRFEVYDGLFPSRKEGINAWVSIMRGCDKFCTFCIVPFTRGRERSRSPKSIIQEVEKAVNNGFVEITLLGQNVNSYKYDNNDFTDLLKQVSAISGLLRLRYTSPHPSDVNEKLLEVNNLAVQRSQDQLDKTQKMFELGAVAKVDVYRSRVNFGNDKINMLLQKNAISLAKNNLNLAMGRQPETEIAINVEGLDIFP